MFSGILISWWILLHPIHLSVTEVDYSQKDRTLQVTTRIFIDDLELSVRKAVRQSELDLLNPGSTNTTDKLAADYLQRHLQIRVDGKPTPLKFLGHEIEDFAIICYLESPVIKKAQQVEVINTVIQETHSDQSNIVHLTFNGPVQSARLTQDEPGHIFTIATKR